MDKKKEDWELRFEDYLDKVLPNFSHRTNAYRLLRDFIGQELLLNREITALNVAHYLYDQFEINGPSISRADEEENNELLRMMDSIIDEFCPETMRLHKEAEDKL